MRYLIILTLALISFGASAQFHDKWRIKFPQGSEPLQVNWVDINNDSLLEVVVANKINGRVSFFSYSDSAFASVHELVRTGFVSGAFVLTDFNRDNRLDIVMSGVDTLANHSTEVYLYAGPFVYEKLPASLSALSSRKVVFADLNSDGQDEWVMNGNGGHLSAWKWKNNSAVQLFDSTNVIPRDILVYDFDGNGFNDIAVSGTDTSAQPKMMIIEFANAYDTIRTIRFNTPVSGKMDAGDVNHDGRMDLLVSGVDNNGDSLTRTFINQTSMFSAGETFNGVSATSLRIADVDADGYADLAVQGTRNSSQLNFIRTFSGDSLSLPTQHLMSQAFGDHDGDGDLDLIQLQDTLGLVLLENQTTGVNSKPPAPAYLASLFIFNRLFLYWTPDIASPTPTSTYDLMLTGSGKRYAAEFDTATWQRMTVTHGNMTANNFALLRIPVANYFARVQAIDNAFLGSRPEVTPGGGICNISSEPLNCPPEVQTLTACSPDPIKLMPKSALQPAAFFSFSKGFLGMHDSLMVENKTDTLFSMSLVGGGYCEMFRIFLINESGVDTINVTRDTTVCEGATVHLNASGEWKDVIWRNAAKDSIGSDTLHYVVRREEVITASARNDYGCVLRQTESLHISKPVLSTNGDAFRIMKGGSVGLSASGADTYAWTPNASLDNGFIPNPVANPPVTTTYTVTGYDTLGCPATAQVLVEVDQTAFVPNLFTPNGDGKNDRLMIYGLSHASNFRFAIHNRDGNLVYESNDVWTITSQGWDGSTRGVEQPPGLYYWKVEGSFDDGSHLNLTGRTTGSILLVR